MTKIHIPNPNLIDPQILTIDTHVTNSAPVKSDKTHSYFQLQNNSLNDRRDWLDSQLVSIQVKLNIITMQTQQLLFTMMNILR